MLLKKGTEAQRQAGVAYIVEHGTAGGGAISATGADALLGTALAIRSAVRPLRQQDHRRQPHAGSRGGDSGVPPVAADLEV